MIMKINVINEKYNPFLKRKELEVSIEHETASTPSKAALQVLVSQEMKKPVEHIEIVNIYSSHGKPTSVSSIFLWDEKKVKDLSKKEESKE
jgi:ribosomal protein S24E